MNVSTISTKRLNELDCVLGLDCSKYQESIDWTKAKASGINFAFIKITEGSTYSEDGIYSIKNRVLEAQKNGVKVGYYHLASPGNISSAEDDAKSEVTNVLNHLKILPKADLPIVLDIEAFNKVNVWTDKIKQMDVFITTFISEMKKNSYNTIIYSYKAFLDENTTHKFGTYPLWQAAYLSDVEKNLPKIAQGWSDWKIWQFTDSGVIDGIKGKVDLDIMRKSYFNIF
jgi:lysozyme